MVTSLVFSPSAPTEKFYKLTIKANEFYERHQFTEAIAEYTRIIQMSKDALHENKEYFALIYSNRSASYLKLNQYEQAKEDAIHAISLSDSWAKGYFRKGEVLLKIGQYDEAIESFKEAMNKDEQINQKDISTFIAKALIEKDNESMGIKIIQLVAGSDIAIEKSMLNPIQSKLYELASHMKNIVHLIVDTQSKQCIVVDACWDIDAILKFTQDQGLEIVATVITHYHFDHIGGSPPPPYDNLPIKISGLSTLLKRLPHIKAYIHPLEIPYIQQAHSNIQLNRLVPTTTDITSHLNIGKINIKFLHTPGHTPGSQSLLVNKSRLIAGDTLLCGGHCGRTDLPGGNRKAMENTLRHVLGDLDDRIVIYPGHDYGSTWSTIGLERENGCLGEELVGFGIKE